MLLEEKADATICRRTFYFHSMECSPICPQYERAKAALLQMSAGISQGGLLMIDQTYPGRTIESIVCTESGLAIPRELTASSRFLGMNSGVYEN